MSKSVGLFPVRLMGMKVMIAQMMTAFMIPIMVDIMAEKYNLDNRHKDESG